MIRVLLLASFASLLIVGCAEAPKTDAASLSPAKAGPKHPVTAEMWQDADKASGQPAPDFAAKDLDGVEHNLASLTGAKPLVLYFIKDGCPCSVDAEPLYQKMQKKFGDKVNFVGVINGDEAIAKKWKDKMETPYPVLLDPELKIVKEFKADRSVYLLAIDKNGLILRMWPGYSQEMLAQLNDLLATVTGAEATPFDAAYAPKEATSGCSFTSDDPDAE